MPIFKARDTDARKSKKRIAAIAIMTIILVGGGSAGAYAYWTAGGTGTGSASTGTNSAVTAVQTSTVSGLVPGSAAQSLSGNFTNSNSSPVYVTSVTAAIASVIKATGAPSGTCDASDYTLTGATMTVGAQVPAGSAQGAWSGATIAFNNKSTIQDACKGASVTISYTVS